MLKSKNKLAGKVLSLFLAMIMIASSAIIAFASTQIALKATNVTEWPTAIGEMFVGQKVGEYITFSGGKVEYNGVEVPGEFVHWKSDMIASTATDAAKASLTFVPDDTVAYKGFNKFFSADVTYKVKKSTPVLKDENSVPVATAIEEGQTLSASKISGGVMKNPYNDSLDLSGTVWAWENPELAVTESGEYPAKWESLDTSYEVVTMNIYVQVLKNVAETDLSTTPTISDFTYNPHITWADVKLEGGKAVVSGSDTEVEGTFAIASKWLATVPTVGSYEIDATFTPNDTEAYTSVNFTIPVTVTPASMSFKTEDGGMPVITVPYSTKMSNDVIRLLKAYVPAEYEASLSFVDFEGKYLPHYNTTPDVGEHEFEVKIDAKSSNYVDAMLKFKLIVEPVTLTPIFEGLSDRMIIRVPGKVYDVKGTFDIYADDILVLTDVAFGQYFTYNYEKSGDIVLKAVYKPGTDNRYIINDIVRVDEDVKLTWNVAIGETSTKYTYGDIVEFNAPSYDTSRKYPIYGFAGWEVLEGDPGLSEEELKNETISFEMPDGNLKLEPTYRFSFKLLFEWIWQQIARFFSFIASVFSELFGMAFAK